MNWQTVALAIGASIFSHQISFRVGKYNVSAFEENGNPVHFTFNLALTAVEAVFAGKTGSIQVGSIKIVITPA